MLMCIKGDLDFEVLENFGCGIEAKVQYISNFK